MSDDERAPEATEGTSQVKGPLPNTVCVGNDLFSGTLDALAYDPRTKFAGGTALVIDSGSGDAIYNLAVCHKQHIHVHLGLACELGQCSVIVVAAYALALAYDRECWRAGYVPSKEGAKDALRDCIAVLRERATIRYADWLVQRCARELAGWCKRIGEVGGALTPHDEASTIEA